MKQDTASKFAAILAAAQAKEANKPTPKFLQPAPAPKVEAQPEPAPEPEKPQLEVIPAPPVPAKLKSFTIVWHEGTGKHDGKTVYNWNDANAIMRRIYNEHEGQGYLKTKVNIVWENGKEITDRIDCGDSNGDFSAKRENVNEYLKRQKSVMYTSNLNVGDRGTLVSFEDAAPADENQLTEEEETQINNTVAEIFSQPAQTVPAAVPANPVQIVDYSDRSFAVIGDTKPIKDKLRLLGGSYNRFLSCGAGWIFSKRRLDAVKQELNIK